MCREHERRHVSRKQRVVHLICGALLLCVLGGEAARGDLLVLRVLDDHLADRIVFQRD